MTKSDLPKYLQKYIVEQNYERYTAIDQAVWRFIIRQLKSYLSSHAHECYLKGMRELGILEDKIPRIDEISKCLKKIGWSAMPVSGFIPPAAFMELQALRILPIASDIRTIDHLLYTPAPDIVHEAAGHAPMLIDPDFADYLGHYVEISNKAIISKEDLKVYEAIRQLSDIKESPQSSSEEIKLAEKKLNDCLELLTHVSEATLLSRFNWWTNEYGLIGSIDQPKIYGAGLLSSLGESRSSLSAAVKKIPLTLDCIHQSYDITEPQPQLYVTTNFSELAKVLHEFSETMAYKKGGLEGLRTAIKAQTVNTAKLNSNIEISGVFTEPLLNDRHEIIYLNSNGPTQLSYENKEILGHHKEYHRHGFGTPLGPLLDFPNSCPSQLSENDWKQIGLYENNKIILKFMSGVTINGTFTGSVKKDNKQIILRFKEAKATLDNTILFDPSWGNYDIVLGLSISSVYGGPADREAYGETEDFPLHRIPLPQYSSKDLYLQNLYSKIRSLRELKKGDQECISEIENVYNELKSHYPDNWLLTLECYELLLKIKGPQSLMDLILMSLQKIKSSNQKVARLIDLGISLANH